MQDAGLKTKTGILYNFDVEGGYMVPGGVKVPSRS